MTEVNNAEKTIGEQVADLLQRKPKNYDVTFSVSPQKIKVEAVKILLKAASLVFEDEFDQNWENAVVKEGEGIPLPDIDPTAFQLFVNLIISDTWTVDALTNLDLVANDLFNLLALCRRFKITKAIKSVEKAATDFIQNFQEFASTEEFCKTSRENLETILSCNDIPLDEKNIFECACRWAEYQCQQNKMEATGENYRDVLGSSFFEIRFPTMIFQDFTKVSGFKKNLFTMEEKVAIYDFIGTDEDEKEKYDKSQLPFKTNLRNSSACSVLRLPKQFVVTENPPFVCEGTVQRNNLFQVNKKVTLHGVGFLGPIGGDTHFDVTVRIGRYVDGSEALKFDSGTFKKNIFATKGKIFYFLLDKPIAIEPNTYDSSWKNFNLIDYSLKGSINVPQHKAEKPKDDSVQISGVEFNLYSYLNRGKPLAELLFKTN